MVSFKRLITCLVLCCVFCDPVVALFTFLHFQKTVVKLEVNRQIQAGIETDELVVFKFSKKEAATKLRWEHAGEFEHNHQMYDVVKTIYLGNTVYYCCLPDHRETKLNRRLDQIVAQTLGNGSKFGEKPELLFSFFKSLYCTFFFYWDGFSTDFLSEKFSASADCYVSIKIPPESPPPQFI